MADVTTQVTVAAEGAQKALAAAQAKSEEMGVPVCITVADAAGRMLAFLRMDGAPVLSAQLSQDKAYTVTAFSLPTADWYPMIKDEPALLHGIVKADRLMIFGGGVPITHGDVIIGAVGVSGGSAEEDAAIAEAGAQALND